MQIVNALEATFKTLDEANPIDVEVEDIVLELEKVARQYWGDKVFASYEGNEELSDPRQAKHKFAVRGKRDGRWRVITWVSVYAEWKPAPGAKFHVYEILRN